MTTRKCFKQVVRARMAKTGERYAAARRALLADDGTGPGATPGDESATAATETGYRMRGGLSPTTAAVANVLADRGMVSQLTGEPLSEAMVLGVGGGLGAGYILWEFEKLPGPLLTLGFSNQWQYPSMAGWFGKTFDRLGVDAQLHETGGARAAAARLDAIVAAGEPAIVLVDEQGIGTWGQPAALSGVSGYPVVVCGQTDREAYLVDDRGSAPLVVPAATMAAARARIGVIPTSPVPPEPEARRGLR